MKKNFLFLEHYISSNFKMGNNKSKQVENEYPKNYVDPIEPPNLEIKSPPKKIVKAINQNLEVIFGQLEEEKQTNQNGNESVPFRLGNETIEYITNLSKSDCNSTTFL